MCTQPATLKHCQDKHSGGAESSLALPLQALEPAVIQASRGWLGAGPD